MKKVIAVASSALAIIGAVLLAPSAWAMLPPPEPGDGGAASTTPMVEGIAIWEVAAIALVALAIGAVGTYVAQRTRRESDPRSVSMA